MKDSRPSIGLESSAPERGELTGFHPEVMADGEVMDARVGRPLSLDWITDGLLADTKDVWFQELGREVSEDEAIDMLINVKRLAETLLGVMRTEENANECGDMGTSLVS